ncbi:hypothetical protein HYH03_009646 [Edaphochlamys debaryana]|uniref:Uncharacterized protein n=1 Tax=Edaphochlamys debaryana TaxID=47281 RepID=A0A835Y432_9CHLO|nr:hypothetical protein HYH03_009646 [Edaphochlamys debaryana]|eukprot:KAG2492155.1 hypothetical protein HYH03_009646 [Edaphochlamys debaryana]
MRLKHACMEVLLAVLLCGAAESLATGKGAPGDGLDQRRETDVAPNARKLTAQELGVAVHHAQRGRRRSTGGVPLVMDTSPCISFQADDYAPLTTPLGGTVGYVTLRSGMRPNAPRSDDGSSLLRLDIVLDPAAPAAAFAAAAPTDLTRTGAGSGPQGAAANVVVALSRRAPDACPATVPAQMLTAAVDCAARSASLQVAVPTSLFRCLPSEADDVSRSFFLQVRVQLSDQACGAVTRPAYAGAAVNSLSAGCSFVIVTGECQPDTCPAAVNTSAAPGSPGSSDPGAPDLGSSNTSAAFLGDVGGPPGLAIVLTEELRGQGPGQDTPTAATAAVVTSGGGGGGGVSASVYGGAIGGAVGAAAALVASVVFVFSRRRSSRRRKDAAAAEADKAPMPPPLSPQPPPPGTLAAVRSRRMTHDGAAGINRSGGDSGVSIQMVAFDNPLAPPLTGADLQGAVGIAGAGVFSAAAAAAGRQPLGRRLHGDGPDLRSPLQPGGAATPTAGNATSAAVSDDDDGTTVAGGGGGAATATDDDALTSRSYVAALRGRTYHGGYGTGASAWLSLPPAGDDNTDATGDHGGGGGPDGRPAASPYQRPLTLGERIYRRGFSLNGATVARAAAAASGGGGGGITDRTALLQAHLEASAAAAAAVAAAKDPAAPPLTASPAPPLGRARSAKLGGSSSFRSSSVKLATTFAGVMDGAGSSSVNLAELASLTGGAPSSAQLAAAAAASSPAGRMPRASAPGSTPSRSAPPRISWAGASHGVAPQDDPNGPNGLANGAFPNDLGQGIAASLSVDATGAARASGPGAPGLAGRMSMPGFPTAQQAGVSALRPAASMPRVTTPGSAAAAGPLQTLAEGVEAALAEAAASSGFSLAPTQPPSVPAASAAAPSPQLPTTPAGALPAASTSGGVFRPGSSTAGGSAAGPAFPPPPSGCGLPPTGSPVGAGAVGSPTPACLRLGLPPVPCPPGGPGSTPGSSFSSPALHSAAPGGLGRSGSAACCFAASSPGLRHDSGSVTAHSDIAAAADVGGGSGSPAWGSPAARSAVGSGSGLQDALSNGLFTSSSQPSTASYPSASIRSGASSAAGAAHAAASPVAAGIGKRRFVQLSEGSGGGPLPPGGQGLGGGVPRASAPATAGSGQEPAA